MKTEKEQMTSIDEYWTVMFRHMLLFYTHISAVLYQRSLIQVCYKVFIKSIVLLNIYMKKKAELYVDFGGNNLKKRPNSFNDKQLFSLNPFLFEN